MAIARCEKHTPEGVKYHYGAYALPLGFPVTAAVCGRTGCEAPARVWLADEERAQYAKGIRVFGIQTFSAKLRVGDELHAS